MKITKIILSKTAHFQQLKSFRTSAALILTTLMLMVVATTLAAAQTYTDLYNFGTNSGDPLQPPTLFWRRVRTATFTAQVCMAELTTWVLCSKSRPREL